MVKFEYDIVIVKEEQDLQLEMEKLGQQGWEIYQVDSFCHSEISYPYKSAFSTIPSTRTITDNKLFVKRQIQ